MTPCVAEMRALEQIAQCLPRIAAALERLADAETAHFELYRAVVENPNWPDTNFPAASAEGDNPTTTTNKE